MNTGRQVVAGIDESGTGPAVVGMAVAEAALRGVPLRIVHALPWPHDFDAIGEALREDARQCVARAVEHARSADPSVAVTGDVITDFAQRMLIGLSHDSALIVLGDRGLGAVGSVLAGSVAVEVIEQSACPIMVCRGSATLGEHIVLGVDGSRANDPAVGFAFEEASLRGCPLDALHVWASSAPASGDGMAAPAPDPAFVEAQEARLLAESLAGWQEKYPDVRVRRHVVHGHVRRVLIEASGHAGLLVVGAHGLGSLRGLLLGSVSQAVLHHSLCPVAIAPQPAKNR